MRRSLPRSPSCPHDVMVENRVPRLPPRRLIPRCAASQVRVAEADRPEASDAGLVRRMLLSRPSGRDRSRARADPDGRLPLSRCVDRGPLTTQRTACRAACMPASPSRIHNASTLSIVRRLSVPGHLTPDVGRRRQADPKHASRRTTRRVVAVAERAAGAARGWPTSSSSRFHPIRTGFTGGGSL